ncbi:MAG: tetratricopeptide repeat protein, partial [Treponema sp.]|nr:tetratricopeptide repeat protein [Treponema sp.]
VLYRRMGKYESAVAAFNAAAEGAPDCFEISYALAMTKMQTGDERGAERDAQKLLDSYGNNRDLLKLAAEASYAAGDLSMAEQYVARVLQQENDNAYYILFRAKILVKKGDYIKAASLLDVYARTDTVSRDYLVLRAKVQKDWNRNNTAALSTIEQALLLYPDDTEIVLAAAELSSQTGAKVAGKTAAELANQILENDPKNISALQIKIAEMQQLHNYTGAYKASSVLMTLQPVPDEAVHTHVAICLLSNHKDEAWDLASRLYSEKPGDNEVVQTYIHTLVNTDRTQDANRMIAQYLPSSNARMKSFLYYERSYLAVSEDAVLGDLRSSLTSNPRNKDALMRLYQIYFNKKEYRKAQYYLKQVVALTPGDENLLVLNRDLDKLLAR